jgi:hypothetical protein
MTSPSGILGLSFANIPNALRITTRWRAPASVVSVDYAVGKVILYEMQVM